MLTILIAVIVTGLSMLGLGVGVLIANRPISGSCGGTHCSGMCATCTLPEGKRER